MSVAAGERRVVSVLVADVVGSTSIAEKLGPERSKYLFDDVVRLMREEVERYGGTVAQLTGDGVLALFGAPTAHENDSERAVRAAFEIRSALAAYSDDVVSAYGLELGARVAVNTGPVVVPTSEAPPDVLYNALGDTVNVAARLQAFGELVLGPTTAHQVDEWFELRPLGELAVKGRSEKVAAFSVIGVRDRPRSRREAPLVGRQAELAEIADVLEILATGRGSIVSVTGEPGIGKSRLVGEAEQRFGDRVRFLVGHAVPYAETIPYWPVREQLRDWLGLGVSDPEARVRLELRARLAASLGDAAADAYPFFATVLGLTLEPEAQQRIAGYAGDVVQRETFDWLYQLVLTLAAESPLCLVLEDMHWSDEATLALLEELLPAAERAAVVFVLVHRSDPGHPAWRLIDRARRRHRALFRELALGSLTESEARALAEYGAGGEIPDELAHRISDLTGGNPYFVGEAVRDLRERGALRRENGSVLVAGETSIPAALQETLQARMDRLDADAREFITTAAVIGRSFGVPLLERVLPRVRLLPTLSELQWLELIVEEQDTSASEYRFRHGLVQEVAYGMLLDTRRRELHGAVAEALVDMHRDSPSEVYGLLGHHFAEAGDAQRAIEYLLKAGDAARAVYADGEAIELYGRALAFMSRTGGDARARETLLRIGLTYHLAFDFAAANRAFAEAFSLPAASVAREEPTERVVWAVTAAWDRVVVPGLSWTKPAWQVGSNVFRGLMAVGRELDLAPDLAERFSVSDDGRVYRFTLRREAWSDGIPVTADDVVFTFKRLVDDAVPTAFLLDGVEASAPDSRTLELRLREPQNHFLYVLALPALFPWPRHMYERDGPDWHRAVPLVGNGPFRLTRRDDDGVLLQADPEWAGARGNVGEVAIELAESAEVIDAGWQKGTYDVVEAALAVADGTTAVERSPAMTTWYLAFNVERPPTNDHRVRLALAHAIDRARWPATIRGQPAHTGGFVPPAMPGHSPRVAPPYDPARARALLAGNAAVGELVVAGLDLWGVSTREIVELLEAVGVEARALNVATDPELFAAIEAEAHAFVWAWNAETPDAGEFLSSIVRDTPMYRDERLEELLAEAASLHDRDERLRRYREYERLWIGEHAAIVPLAYSKTELWHRSWITGMWVNGFGMASFAEAVVRR